MQLREQNNDYTELIEKNKKLWEYHKRITDSLDKEDNILVWKYLENKIKIDMIEKEELYYWGRKDL